MQSTMCEKDPIRHEHLNQGKEIQQQDLKSLQQKDMMLKVNQMSEMTFVDKMGDLITYNTTDLNIMNAQTATHKAGLFADNVWFWWSSLFCLLAAVMSNAIHEVKEINTTFLITDHLI